MSEPAPVFGLVHGGRHGAWCWRRVIDELTREGCRAVAVDLPCENESAGAREYAEVVVRSLADVERPVVIVAHSLGGLTAPLVSLARPVSRLIFLAAWLPVPGRSQLEQEAEDPDMRILHPGIQPEVALRLAFYNTCSPSDADWAMSLIRNQSPTPRVERTPLQSWPSVPCSYIVCGEDRRINPVWQRRAARDRLGIEPVELEGTGHSPFLDRPQELTRLLLELAKPMPEAADNLEGGGE